MVCVCVCAILSIPPSHVSLHPTDPPIHPPKSGKMCGDALDKKKGKICGDAVDKK